MNIVMNIETGIISGEQKRVLECYVDSRHFRQRKSFDEYYVDIDIVEFKHGINDLMILAEEFSIQITSNSLVIR